MFWPRRRVPDQCLQSSVSVGALSFWAVFFSLNASGLVLVHARLHLFAPFEMVDGDFGSFASGGRWAAASPRTPMFWESVCVFFYHLAVVLAHARLLSFAASEQVWRGFGSFASGGRWAAASPRTPVFSESFSVIWLWSCLMLVCFPL